MKKRCVLLVIEIAILAVFLLISAKAISCSTGSFIPSINHRPAILSFIAFSLAQLALYKETYWQRIANAVLFICKSILCIMACVILVYPVFRSSNLALLNPADLGDFGSYTWFTILTCTLGVLITLFLAIDLVFVGVDVVRMVKKLAKHFQAKRQKA